MKLTAVFLSLAGLAFTAGHGTHHGYRHQHGSCGEVALIRQDNTRRTSRCMRRLEHKIEQAFNVDVVQGRRKNALRNTSVDKNTDCNELINDVTCDVEETIKRKYNRRRANSCILKKSRCKRDTRTSTPTKRSEPSTKASHSTNSSKKSRSTSRSATPRCHKTKWNTPPELYTEEDCPGLFQVDTQVNQYWENPSFVCRTDERPCEAPFSSLELSLDNGMALELRPGDSDDEASAGGPNEVWQVRTDKYGRRKTWPWNSRYRFWAEGRWVETNQAVFGNDLADFNNYGWDSLECIGPWDNDDYMFIIMDGVLVDSCPKSIAQECRSCKATSTKSSKSLSKSTTTSPSKSKSTSRSKRVRGGCGAPEYVDSGYPSCQDVVQGGHVNSYWDNPNFLCKTDERPCEASDSTFELRLGNDMVLDLKTDFYGDEYDGGPAEVWVVSADRNGDKKTLPWKSQYRFFAESRWIETNEATYWDYNNYRFDSLECIEPWDDDDYLFIIVDGVLVDSCPKRIAQECRACNDR